MARKTIPSHLSKLHRRLHSLYATQWAPRDTRRDSTGEAIPLRGLEGVPGLPGAPQDEAGLTRKLHGMGLELKVTNQQLQLLLDSYIMQLGHRSCQGAARYVAWSSSKGTLTNRKLTNINLASSFPQAVDVKSLGIET